MDLACAIFFSRPSRGCAWTSPAASSPAIRSVMARFMASPFCARTSLGGLATPGHKTLVVFSVHGIGADFARGGRAERHLEPPREAERLRSRDARGAAPRARAGARGSLYTRGAAHRRGTGVLRRPGPLA